MATDRSLATLLRALHSPSSDQDASRLLGSASTILTLLSNPLNVNLLTNQILTAPAVWHNSNELGVPFRVLSAFNAASIRILQNETLTSMQGPYPTWEGLAKEEWVKAVVSGADDRSPRWRHMLALGGLLLGFESQHRRGLSVTLRRTLESAIVEAANLALDVVEPGDEVASTSIALVLSHVFDMLGRLDKSQINHNLLLPLLIRAAYFSRDGFHWGYFLGTIDADVVQDTAEKFVWSTKSSTYFQTHQMSSGPLIASLGSLSRLAAFSVEVVHDEDCLIVMVEDLSAFCRSLCVQWRQNKLSEIDIAEEMDFLSDESLKVSLPVLWQFLKASMFATMIVLRALLGRVLGDRRMLVNEAPFVAIQALHILRNLYFISSRLGHNAFSQHTFVHLTAIDILSKYPVQAEAFLRDIKPAQFGRLPLHPLDRCHDLFFLNTAEYFTIVLTRSVNEDLLLAAAAPYLGIGIDSRLLNILEAAHSIMLAVLQTPQNSELISKYLPSYVDTLFKVFPQNLSPRQFRVAIQTLIRITTPPSIISERQPLLATTLLELVYTRVSTASNLPIPPPPPEDSNNSDPTLTEQAVMALTLIDCLPFLPLDLLEEWLPLVAESVNTINDQDMSGACKQRFWGLLSGGEMDVARAAVCVAWWNTRGGRERMLFGRHGSERGPSTTGGLAATSKL